MAQRIAFDRPSRVLYLGDVYERGSASDFRDGYAGVYGRLARITAPTPGNRDWPAHPDGYEPYWQGKTGAPGRRGTRPRRRMAVHQSQPASARVALAG